VVTNREKRAEWETIHHSVLVKNKEQGREKKKIQDIPKVGLRDIFQMFKEYGRGFNEWKTSR
jgi:hypothetical protein